MRSTAIGARLAIALYVLLVVIAVAVLHGKPLVFTLIVIGGIALKSLVGFLRDRTW